MTSQSRERIPILQVPVESSGETICVTPKMRPYPQFGTRASSGIDAHLVVSSIGAGAHERDSHGYAHSWQVLIKLTSSYLEPVLNKVSTLPHNRGHGFTKRFNPAGEIGRAHV